MKREFKLALLGLVALMVLAASACEPVAPISIRNATDQVLSIYIKHVYIGDIAPGQTIRNRSLIHGHDSYRIMAKNAAGRWVYAQDWSWSKLRSQKYRVVISLEGGG